MYMMNMIFRIRKASNIILKILYIHVRISFQRASLVLSSVAAAACPELAEWVSAASSCAITGDTPVTTAK